VSTVTFALVFAPVDDAGTVVLNDTGVLTVGQAITLGPGGSSGPHGLVGVAVVSPGIPPSPVTPSVPLSAIASPGLAGTSGIQPQLDVDALRDSRSLWDELFFTAD
jgi:hypothetical protein